MNNTCIDCGAKCFRSFTKCWRHRDIDSRANPCIEITPAFKVYAESCERRLQATMQYLAMAGGAL